VDSQICAKMLACLKPVFHTAAPVHFF